MNFVYLNICAISVLFFLCTSVTSAHTPLVNVRESVVHTILMDDEHFSETDLIISQGDTVVFKNIGQNEHWPASNLHPTHEVYAEFDSLTGVKAGDSWSFVFTKPGIWRFHDHLVPSITGSIEVKRVLNSDLEGTQSSFSFISIRNSISLHVRAMFYIYYYKFVPDEREKTLSSLLVYDLVNKEQELDLWLRVFSPNILMDKLFVESGLGRLRNCHLETHTIGLRSYTLFGAEAFEKGSTQCSSGYIHGVFAGFLAKNGTEDVMSKFELFCSELDTPYAQRMCFHGIGHALTAYEDFNLPKVIELCRTIHGDYQNSCLAGMVMENVETGKGNGIFSFHQTPWLSLDPHFPCNDSLFRDDSELLPLCYGMQSSWMSALYKYDLAKVVRECLNAVQGGILMCFEGVGREATALNSYDPIKVTAICDQIEHLDNYNQCIKGGLFPTLNSANIKLQDQGSRFCDLVRETSQDYCYKIMRERLSDYFTETRDIKRICDTFAPKYQYLCDGL